MHYAVAVLLSAGLVFAQQTAPAPGSAVAPPGGGAWEVSRAERLAVILGLSADQTTEVRNLLDEEASQLKPLGPQLQESRRAIRQLVVSGTSGTAFETQLQALASTEASIVSQTTVIRAKTMAKLWALLTPEQRQKAAQLPGILDLEGQGFMRRRPRRMYPSRTP
jgi:Spy/CpxP family protein refolding chaperone